jgi:hypothetical protein
MPGNGRTNGNDEIPPFTIEVTDPVDPVVQITLTTQLERDVDRASKMPGQSKEAWICDAIAEAVERRNRPDPAYLFRPWRH